MLLNISRGKEFSLGDLGYFFEISQTELSLPVCAGTDPGDHSHSLLLCKLYHRSGTNSGGNSFSGFLLYSYFWQSALC